MAYFPTFLLMLQNKFFVTDNWTRCWISSRICIFYILFYLSLLGWDIKQLIGLMSSSNLSFKLSTLVILQYLNDLKYFIIFNHISGHVLVFFYVRSPDGQILLQSPNFFFFRLSWNFFSARFGPLGLRNCNKKVSRLSSVCCLSNTQNLSPA